MAGIGFELRKLTQRDNLLGIIQGYSHSALTATGPWLLTIISLSAIVLYGSSTLTADELNSFRLIVIYNFAFSLVISGPVVMVATRFLADRIYARDVEQAPGLVLGSLILVFAFAMLFAVPFYLFYVNITFGLRLAAIANFAIVTGIWLISVFLTALKDYNSITGTFGIGMLGGLLGATMLSTRFSTTGMLLGFTLGLGLIFFSLLARVLSEYPYKVVHPFNFRGYFRKHWLLAASGFTYNSAIWIDKWIMWSAPEATTLSTRMVSYPDYDSAMFLAYLTIVPSMAAFVLAIETDFFEEYLRFYGDIQDHATYSVIVKNHQRVLASVLRGARNFIVLQGSICVTVLLLAPQLFTMLGVNFIQLGIFRIGVLGALFHVLFLAVSIIISYFDLRKETLILQTVFLVSNGVLTYISLNLGFRFYGYGYFTACLIAFAVSFVMLARFIGELPYRTFVVNNTSVR